MAEPRKIELSSKDLSPLERAVEVADVAEDDYIDGTKMAGRDGDSEERNRAALVAAFHSLKGAGLRGFLEDAIYGWEQFEGHGAMNFQQDELDGDLLVERLINWMTDGREPEVTADLPWKGGSMSEEIESKQYLTDRGFRTYAEFEDVYAATVTVRESSAAEDRFVWVFVKGSQEERRPNDGAAHLTVAHARVLRDALTAFIENQRVPGELVIRTPDEAAQ